MKKDQDVNKLDVVASILLGIGLALGIIPILIASLTIKQDLMLVIFDKMDLYWRSRGWV
jgi:hypothetical protein